MVQRQTGSTPQPKLSAWFSILLMQTCYEIGQRILSTISRESMSGARECYTGLTEGLRARHPQHQNKRQLGNERKLTYTTLRESIGESGLTRGNGGGGADENDRGLHVSYTSGLKVLVVLLEIFGKNFCGQMDDQKIWCKKMRVSNRLRMC